MPNARRNSRIILGIVAIGAIAIAGILFTARRPSLDFNRTFAVSLCPDVSRTPLYPSSYAGPLIDTHVHIPNIPDRPAPDFLSNENSRPLLGVNASMDDYICMMNTEGTKAVFAFFPVWDPIREESISIVRETLKRYPGRFIPFIMPPEHDDRPDGFPTVQAQELESMLADAREIFSGYGEIGLYARGDHGGPTGAPELPPYLERLQEIYPVVRQNKLLVYFHLGEGQAESFKQTLAANPDISFIWHGDQLIPQENGRQDLSAIEDILSKYPNAHYGVDELYGDTWLLRPEIGKKEFLAHFEQYEPLLAEDLQTWKGFIERHPDQALWGTDRGWSAPWSIDQDVAITLNTYSRAFIGRLDPSVQEKFAYKNAERLAKSVAQK